MFIKSCNFSYCVKDVIFICLHRLFKTNLSLHFYAIDFLFLIIFLFYYVIINNNS